MAHSEFTGYSGGTTITFDGDSIPTGWRKITISEKGKPLSEQLDITHAGDAAYAFMDDPLGAKGQASCSVVVEGFLSVTDHQDSGILAAALDSEGDVVVTTATGGDEFTATGAAYKSFDTGAAFAAVVPYTLTFTLASGAGAWATNA